MIITKYAITYFIIYHYYIRGNALQLLSSILRTIENSKIIINWDSPHNNSMKKKQNKSGIPPLANTIVHHRTKGLFRERKVINSYMIKQVLGTGGFATCFLASRKVDGKLFALKVIDKAADSMKKEGAQKRLQSEIQIMQNCDYKNIVSLKQTFDDEKYSYLLLEYCQKNSIQQMMKKRKKLTEPEVKYYMRQLMEVLVYLREHKIIHRDIKTCNIMLDKNMNLKLGDFGLATYENNPERKQRYSVCGTPNYMAPEIIKRKKSDSVHYSYEIDMWSSGIVAYNLLFGVLPFHDKQTEKVQAKILQTPYKFPANNSVSQAAKNFIASLLMFNPQERVKPTEALEHQFIKDKIPIRIPIHCYNRQPTKQQLIVTKHNQGEARKIYKIMEISKTDGHIEQKQCSIYTNRKTDSQNQSSERTIKKQRNKVQGMSKLGETIHKDRNRKNNKKCDIEKQEGSKPIQAEAPKNIPNHKLAQESQIKQPVIKVENQAWLRNQEFKVEQPEIDEKNTLEQKAGEINNQESVVAIPPLHEWLINQLSDQIYIHEFIDKTSKYGFCYHLSNSAMFILFNDRTSMGKMGISPETTIFMGSDRSWKILTKDMMKENSRVAKKYKALCSFIKQTTLSPCINRKSLQQKQRFEPEIQSELKKSMNFVEYWCRFHNNNSYNRCCPEENTQAYLFSTSKLIQIYFCQSTTNIYIKNNFANQERKNMSIMLGRVNKRQKFEFPGDQRGFEREMGKNIKVFKYLLSHLMDFKKQRYNLNGYHKTSIKQEDQFFDRQIVDMGK